MLKHCRVDLTFTAEAGGIVLERISTVLPFTSQALITTSTDSVQMIDDRIQENKCSTNGFGTNVLRCRTCGQCFYGGKGINDNQLFKQHFKEHPDHAVAPTIGKKYQMLNGILITKLANLAWR